MVMRKASGPVWPTGRTVGATITGIRTLTKMPLMVMIVTTSALTNTTIISAKVSSVVTKTVITADGSTARTRMVSTLFWVRSPEPFWISFSTRREIDIGEKKASFEEIRARLFVKKPTTNYADRTNLIRIE